MTRKRGQAYAEVLALFDTKDEIDVNDMTDHRTKDQRAAVLKSMVRSGFIKKVSSGTVGRNGIPAKFKKI